MTSMGAVMRARLDKCVDTSGIRLFIDLVFTTRGVTVLSEVSGNSVCYRINNSREAA